jgi:choline kinase
MNAVILAAGRGSRMGELTRELPKCLVTLAGRPLLEWQLAALRGAGIERIAVVRGYQAQLFDGRGVETFENPRWADTNMVASLACASDWLREAPVIVSYSDIFYTPPAVADLTASAADIAIAYDPEWQTLWSARFENPLSDAETFRLEGARLVDIGRRPTSVDEVRGQYMGLLKFTPAGWAAVERCVSAQSSDRRDRLDMTSLLSLLVARDEIIEGVPVSGPWGEADSASDIALYERMIATGQLELPRVDAVA